MAIHENHRPGTKYVRRYNKAEAAKVAAIISGTEDEIAGRRAIFSRRRRALNTAGNDVFDEIAVTARSYDSLSYVLFLPFGKDSSHSQLLLLQNVNSGGNVRKIVPEQGLNVLHQQYLCVTESIAHRVSSTLFIVMEGSSSNILLTSFEKLN